MFQKLIADYYKQ